MTQTQYIIGRKLNIPELGKTLGNISDAGRSKRSRCKTHEILRNKV